MGRLDGKTVLITAAGQGIGRETATLFAAEGAEVWATDIDVAKLRALGDCEHLPLDVRDADDIAAVLSRTGPLDVLFNCAGYVASGTILDCTESDWALSFDLNVTGPTGNEPQARLSPSASCSLI
jgi:2-keto-3-deoxy-L-fuconate dehydrogenase